MKSYDDPSVAYDQMVDYEERYYRDLIRDKCCGQCANCQVPEFDFFADGYVGYCHDMSEFVHTTDTPQFYECDAFDPRGGWTISV